MNNADRVAMALHGARIAAAALELCSVGQAVVAEAVLNEVEQRLEAARRHLSDASRREEGGK